MTEVQREAFQIESPVPEKKKGCRCFARTETVGYYHCGFGRLVIFSTMLFLSTSILFLASEDAGCDDDESSSTCDKPVMGGLRPSSLLPLINACASFITACLMPMLGAIVDHSPYRRNVGLWSSVMLIIVNIGQAFIGPDTWLAMMILSVFSAMAYITVLTVQLSYLPELKTDEPKVLTIAGKSRAFEMAGVLFLLIFAAIMGRVMVRAHDNNADQDLNAAKQSVIMAQVSQIIGVICGGPSLIFCWHYCFKDRPSLHETDISRSKGGYLAAMWWIGVKGIFKTVGFLREEFPNVVNYLYAFAFWEAASSGITAMSTSFLIFELDFNTQEVVIFFLITIVVAIPSAVVSRHASLQHGLHRSLKGSLLYSIVLFVTFALFCNSKPVAFVYAVLVGVQTGWINPVQRFAFSNIIPGGRETELFGLFSFASQAVSWIPAMIFIMVNQGLGGNLRLAFLCPVFFYVIGFVLIITTVDFDVASAAVRSTLEKRKGPAYNQFVKVRPATSSMGSELESP